MSQNYCGLSHVGYPGVIETLEGGAKRLAVGTDGKRYVLQSTDAASRSFSRWAVIGWAKSLATLVQRHGSAVPELVELAGNLPDDPALAKPDAVELLQAQKAAYSETNPRGESYARVLASAGDWRFAVDYDGTRYLLQRRYWFGWDTVGRFQAVHSVSSKPGLVERLEQLHQRQDEMSESDFECLINATYKLPLLARSGVWAALPPRPVSHNRQRRMAGG